MNPTSRRRKTKHTMASRAFVFASASILAYLVMVGWGLVPVPVPSRRFLPEADASSSEHSSPRHKNTFPLPIVPNYNNANGNANGQTSDHAISSLLKELDSFVSDAVSYLLRISHTPEQDPKFPGRFTYQADLRRPLRLQRNHWAHKPQPDYNLLRHNGAIYALSQAFQRTSESNTEAIKANILRSMDRAVGYLRDNALLPVPGHKDQWLAAWERVDPEDPHSQPETAKLGGAGLAMVALGMLENIKPNAVSLEKELRRLGAFIESLQNKKDGSFTCKYHWGTGPDNEWVSLYYPGEAALGLVTLAELELQKEERDRHPKRMVTAAELELEHHHHMGDPPGGSSKEKQSKRWIKVATNALMYLEGLRRDTDLDDIDPDHWALLATAKLLPILETQRHELKQDDRKRKQADLEYWVVYNHGVRVATSIVADHTTEGLKKHKGCFTYDERTCPTATRLEGLLAAMTFVQDSEIYFGGGGDGAELLKDRLERDVDTGIRFLLKSQQKNDANNMRGAVPGNFNGRKPVLPPGSSSSHEEDASKSKSNSNDESSEDEEHDEDFELADVRVDYVQHSMSAVMAYEAFLIDKLAKRHKGKAFHEKVHEHVHKVVHHVKHKIDVASASSTFVNCAIMGSVCLLLTIVVCLAYLPWSAIPFLGRPRRRRRRVKRND